MHRKVSKDKVVHAKELWHGSWSGLRGGIAALLGGDQTHTCEGVGGVLTRHLAHNF